MAELLSPFGGYVETYAFWQHYALDFNCSTSIVFCKPVLALRSATIEAFLAECDGWGWLPITCCHQGVSNTYSIDFKFSFAHRSDAILFKLSI